jgi:hypothetical protein
MKAARRKSTYQNKTEIEIKKYNGKLGGAISLFYIGFIYTFFRSFVKSAAKLLFYLQVKNCSDILFICQNKFSYDRRHFL